MKFNQTVPASILNVLTAVQPESRTDVYFDDEDTNIHWVDSNNAIVRIDGFDVAAVYDYEGDTYIKVNHIDNAPEDDISLRCAINNNREFNIEVFVKQ